MRRIILKYFFVSVMAALVSIKGICLAIAADDLEAKIEDARKQSMDKYNYVTTVSGFNGEVEVAQRDVSGRVEEKHKVILKPGKKIEIPENTPMKEGKISWKDVAQFETVLARDRDPIARWFVENTWRDRINRVYDILDKKLYEKHREAVKKLNDKYEGLSKDRAYSEALQELRKKYLVNILVRDVAIALGIPVPDGAGPPVGPLTKQSMWKVQNKFGGRVENVDLRFVEEILNPTIPEVPETQLKSVHDLPGG